MARFSWKLQHTSRHVDVKVKEENCSIIVMVSRPHSGPLQFNLLDKEIECVG
jgi:hypothetical protein